MTCAYRECDHEVWYGDHCACHIGLNEFAIMSEERKLETINQIALESEFMQVSADGYIRIEIEEVDE